MAKAIVRINDQETATLLASALRKRGLDAVAICYPSTILKGWNVEYPDYLQFGVEMFLEAAKKFREDLEWEHKK